MQAVQVTKETLVSGVYNVVGSDCYWLDKIESLFSAKTEDSITLNVFSQLYSIGDALGCLETLSFSGEPNVIIIKDKDFKLDDKGHKLLFNALNSDISPNFLVFIGCNFLDAKEKKLMTAIVCDPLKKGEITPIVTSMFTNGIEKSAVNLLIDYTNGDLARISLEGDKLKSYCPNKEITVADVENLVVEDADVQIYQFVNSVVAGKNELALRQLEKLNKRGEAYSYLLASLILQFRRMLHSSLSPLSDGELADKFKVKEFAITKAREIRGFSKMKLKQTLGMLVDYELRFKSGQMSEQTAFMSAISRLLAKEV